MRRRSPEPLPAAARAFLVALAGLVVAVGVAVALTYPEQDLQREGTVLAGDDHLRQDGGAR